MEPECLLFGRIELQPISAGRFQQGVSTDNVGLDKFAGTGNRAVNMTFSGQMHHDIWLTILKHLLQLLRVTNIGLNKLIAIRICH